MADEVCKSWPRLLGAPNQQSAYQKTISSYFLASCSLEMGYLQRKKFFLLHFFIFKSYFYAYFSSHITGPKFIGGGGVRRGSAKSPSLSYFFFEAFPNLMQFSANFVFVNDYTPVYSMDFFLSYI